MKVNQMIEYISVEKEAEESYSFAFGDEIRQSILSPWKLPFLPFLIPYRFFKLNKKVNDVNPNQSADILMIYDLEKMRQKEQKAFVKQSMNYSQKIISLGIGQPLINVSFNHHIPSRSEWNIEARKWNYAVEDLILGLIRAHKPKKLIFVGKYPYAGVLEAIRRCNSTEKMYWISVRGDKSTMDERSARFKKVIDINYFTESDLFIKNTIHFDEQSTSFKEIVKETLEQNSINILSNPNNAEYVVVSNPNTDLLQYLLKNQTVIYDSETDFIAESKYPSFVLPNMVRMGVDNQTKIFKDMFDFRNKNTITKSQITSVQSKIDIWINS